MTKEIKKILTNEKGKYPWLVEIYTEKRLYKFRFENLTEFRDFLYLFLHAKTKLEELPLFIPNEYVGSSYPVQPDHRAVFQHPRENRRPEEEDQRKHVQQRNYGQELSCERHP